MLQIIFKIARRARHLVRKCSADERQRWRADPLAHPALSAMSPRELADLPIGHPILPAVPCGCER